MIKAVFYDIDLHRKVQKNTMTFASDNEKQLFKNVCQNTSADVLKQYPRVLEYCERYKGTSIIETELIPIINQQDLAARMQKLMSCTSIVECTLYSRLNS